MSASTTWTPISDRTRAAIRAAMDRDVAVSLVTGRMVSSAMRFAREAESGNVHINWTPLWRADFMPYGGFKGSGIGKEGPRYAIEEMTEFKTVVIHGLGG